LSLPFGCRESDELGAFFDLIADREPDCLDSVPWSGRPVFGHTDVNSGMTISISYCAY
jgi:hypothetical protein